MFLWSQHWLSSPLGRLTSCAQQHEFLTSGPTSTALAPPHHWPDEQLTYSTSVGLTSRPSCPAYCAPLCVRAPPLLAPMAVVVGFVLLLHPVGHRICAPLQPLRSPFCFSPPDPCSSRGRQPSTPLTVVVPPRAHVAKRPRAPSGWAEAARGRGAACCRIVVTVPILASMAVGRPESAPSPVAMMNRDDKSVEVRSPL